MKHVIFALLLPSLAFGQADETSRSWNQPVEPFRITGNLYYVGANEVTSFLLTSKEGHVVLDGGFVETAPMILANIRKLGFRPEDVKILLSSHAHYDHAAGLAELKRVTGAKFYASRRDIPQHARGGLDDPQFGNRFPYPPIYADRVLDHGSRVRLGPINMLAHMTPGHTPGCTTWTTTIGGKEVVFLCSPSVPSQYRLRDNPRYPDAIADYRRQFAILKALTPDIWLASHGNFFNLEEKRTGKRSFVDPEGYRRFVEASEQSFEKRAVE